MMNWQKSWLRVSTWLDFDDENYLINYGQDFNISLRSKLTSDEAEAVTWARTWIKKKIDRSRFNEKCSKKVFAHLRAVKNEKSMKSES